MEIVINLDNDAKKILESYAKRRNIPMDVAVNAVINRYRYQNEVIRKLKNQLAEIRGDNGKSKKEREHERWMREHNLKLF